MTTPLLTIENLAVAYGGVQALHGVDLEIPAGEFRAVLGPNGAGKSTIVRTITGLLAHHKGKVTSGSVRLFNDELVGRRADQIIRRGIAQVPEGRVVLAEGTVDENLRLGVSAVRISARVLQSRLEGIYDRFPQLASRRKSAAGMLSGGEQQMVAIGRALVAEPKLLVCDELSLGLAPKLVRELLTTISESCRTTGTACLLIEQNARLALSFSDYAYVLEAGMIGLSGPSEALRGDSSVMEHYLGLAPVVAQNMQEPASTTTDGSTS